MTVECELLLSLLRLSISESKVRLTRPANWRKILDLALLQGVVSCALDGVQKLRLLDSGGPDIELMLEWIGQSQCGIAKSKMQFDKATELASLLSENGIHTIVLKGSSIASYYKSPWDRESCDLDCYLLDSNNKPAFENGNIIVESIGVSVDRSHYKHSHFIFEGLTVENHQFCTGVRGKKWLKKFETLLQELLISEPRQRLGHAVLEQPSLLFSMLFFIQHSLSHFLREGITLKHLVDWAYLLKAVQDNNGVWSEFNKVCEEYGLWPYAESLTRLVCSYLGVESTLISDFSLRKQDSLLLEDTLKDRVSPNELDGKYRIRILRNEILSFWKFEYFSNQSYINSITHQILGFFFDQHPSLK